jgi:hypothetical protein
MRIMRVDRLTMAEAENLIAVLWRTLEQQGIPSPQLRICQVGDLVDLTIEFLSQQDGDLVKGVMSRLATDAAEY